MANIKIITFKYTAGVIIHFADQIKFGFPFWHSTAQIEKLKP